MRVIAIDALVRILSDALEDDVIYEELLGSIRKQTQEAYTWLTIEKALRYEQETWKEIKQQHPDLTTVDARIRELELLIDIGESLLKRSECGVLV